MYKALPLLLALLFSALPSLASATPAADKVIEDARANCRSFENGELSMNTRAITLMDVSGDGQRDEIIDSRHFSCSTSASYFCGTGGCVITVIVDGKPTEFFAKGYKVVTWHSQPLLLLAVHGAACNGTGVRKCYEVHVWSQGAFRSPGAP